MSQWSLNGVSIQPKFRPHVDLLTHIVNQYAMQNIRNAREEIAMFLKHLYNADDPVCQLQSRRPYRAHNIYILKEAMPARKERSQLSGLEEVKVQMPLK